MSNHYNVQIIENLYYKYLEEGYPDNVAEDLATEEFYNLPEPDIEWEMEESVTDLRLTDSPDFRVDERRTN